MQGLLDELKSFSENELTSYLDRPNHVIQPLDLSQQDFLQSFGNPFQQPPFMFNPFGPGGLREGHQQQMHSIQQQQEYERIMAIRSAQQVERSDDYNRVTETQTPKEDETANFEPGTSSPSEPPIAAQGFPPNFPIPHHPLMMPRPPMFMMPQFLYPVPGFPIPQNPMMPPTPSMMNFNMMGSLVSPKSSMSPSTFQPLTSQEHREGVEVSEMATPVLAEGIDPNQRESSMFVDSTTMSEDLAAVETLPPSSLAVCEGNSIVSPRVDVSESVVAKPDQDVFDEDSFSTGTMSGPKDSSNQSRADVLPSPFQNVNMHSTVQVNENNYLGVEPVDTKAHTVHGGSRPNKKADSQLHGESDRQRLPCRRQQNGSRDSRQQGQLKTNSQHSRRQNPRAGQEREGRLLKSHLPDSSQLPTDSQKLSKTIEKKTTSQDASVSIPSDSGKASPSKTGSRSSQSKGGKGGGGRGAGKQHQKRLSSGQSSGGGGATGSSSQSQNLGGRSFNRRQDEVSRQASSHAERDVQDATRAAVGPDTGSEVLPGFPCSAFQPRCFGGRILTPSHPPTFPVEPDSEYSTPTLVQDVVNKGQSVTQLRWKFTDVPHEDSTDVFCPSVTVDASVLDCVVKGDWRLGDRTSSYAETVEDPFHTYTNSQAFWDSDVGDFMTLTSDESPPTIQANIPGNPPPSVVVTSPDCPLDNSLCNNTYLSSFDFSLAKDVEETRPTSECVGECSGREWVI